MSGSQEKPSKLRVLKWVDSALPMLRSCPASDIEEMSPAARRTVAKVLRDHAAKFDTKD